MEWNVALLLFLRLLVLFFCDSFFLVICFLQDTIYFACFFSCFFLFFSPPRQAEDVRIWR